MLNRSRSGDLQGSGWGGFIRFVKFLIEFGVQCHGLSDQATRMRIKTSAPIPHSGLPAPPRRPRQQAAQAKRCPKAAAVWWAAPAKPLSPPRPAPGPQTSLAKSCWLSVCLHLVGCLDLLFVCSFSLFFKKLILPRVSKCKEHEGHPE